MRREKTNSRLISIKELTKDGYNQISPYFHDMIHRFHFYNVKI